MRWQNNIAKRCAKKRQTLFRACRYVWKLFSGGSRPISRVLSWATIPLGATLPMRSSSLPGSNASHAMRFPIWPCFGWGLPCRPCRHVRGGLLPHRFTLAVPGYPGLGRSTLCCTFRRLCLTAYSARPLAGILLYEARTFLSVL